MPAVVGLNATSILVVALAASVLVAVGVGISMLGPAPSDTAGDPGPGGSGHREDGQGGGRGAQPHTKNRPQLRHASLHKAERPHADRGGAALHAVHRERAAAVGIGRISRRAKTAAAPPIVRILTLPHDGVAEPRAANR